MGLVIDRNHPLAGKKCYISGKISGLKFEEAQHNFSIASRNARSWGMIALDPMNFTHDHDCTWESYMKEDLRQMMKCQVIYMQRNWTKSRGARIEHRLAWQLGFNVIYESKYRVRILEAVKNENLKKIIRFLFGIKKNVYLIRI